jgi:hypothetical protein
MALRSRLLNDMVVAWHVCSTACVNQIWPHCVNQMEKTQSKPSVAQYGREQHGMCDLGFNMSTLKITFHIFMQQLSMILYYGGTQQTAKKAFLEQKSIIRIMTASRSTPCKLLFLSSE